MIHTVEAMDGDHCMLVELGHVPACKDSLQIDLAFTGIGAGLPVGKMGACSQRISARSSKGKG